MLRTLLAPRWLALHVLTLVVVAAMVWLGSWQYGAAQEGREREARQAEGAVPIAELVRPGASVPADAVDRSVVLSGAWSSNAQLTVPGRPLDQVMGAYVLAPLELDDGTSALVLRGWVEEFATPERPLGRATVTGTLRPYETQADATLDRDTDFDAGQLPYVGAQPVEEALGSDGGPSYAGFVVLETQEPEPPPGAPIPVSLDVVAPQTGVGIWQHFSYWAQWWIFAAAAVLFWAVLVRGAVRAQRQAV